MIPRTFMPCVLLLALASEGLAQGADEPPPLTWTVNRTLRDVRRVFCHPTDPCVAWLATSEGLLKTVDEGRTFQPIPSASADKVGVVTALVCCPADERRLVLGTQDRGLFVSLDGGQSWQAAGGEGDRPASDHIAYLDFCDSDPSWQTLLVTHGRAAPGLSVSRDFGKTWEVFGTDRYLKSFAKDGDTIVAAGSMIETDGEVWGVHRSGFDGQRWEECGRDVRPGQAALSLFRPLRFLFSTLDGKVLESNDDGRTWYPVANVESATWTSLVFTHGRTDNAEILVAYDPYRHGVVLSTRRFRPGSWSERNQGLYVAPFVKSGAVCRPNANGTIFYIVMNNCLWVGRRSPAKTGPTVVQARCLPATMWIQDYATRKAQSALHAHIQTVAAGVPGEADVAAIAQAHGEFSKLRGGLAFTVQAKVDHPKGPAALKVVTVDLSLLGQSRSAELFDDGKHGDGKPADGLWARQVPFLPSGFSALSSGDRRPRLPGKSVVTVTAIDKQGASDNWSAVLAIYQRPQPVSIWPGGRHFRFPGTETEGDVSVHEARGEGPEKGDALCFDASGPGPWRGAWIMGAAGVNTSGRDALSFYIRGDVNQELYVHIVDHYVQGENMIDVPHYSQPAPLISGGYLKQVTPEYQRVRIPIEKLLPKGTLFLRRHTAGIALAVDKAGKPGRYYVAGVRIEP